MSGLTHHRVARVRAPVLITGGAGFIGTNLAHRLICDGWPVRILDKHRDLLDAEHLL